MSEIEDTYQCNEEFIKNYNGESNGWCFLEVDVQYLEKLHDLQNHFRLLLDRMKNEKFGKLAVIKFNILYSYEI